MSLLSTTGYSSTEQSPNNVYYNDQNNYENIGLVQKTRLDLPQPTSSELRIMSYNIRVDHEADQNTENEWRFRRDKVINVIKHYDPDIIGIQEPNNAQVEDLKEEFKEKYDIVHVPANPIAYQDRETYKSEQHRETHAIMFRRDKIELIGKIQHFWLAENPQQLPEQPQWDGSPFTRLAVYAELCDKKTGRIFHLFNAHFDHVGTIARINSAKLMMDTALKISEGRPFVVLGDFNTFVRDGGPETREAFEEYEAQGVFDVRKMAKEIHGPNNTWVGWSNNQFREEVIKINNPEETLKEGQDQARFDQFYVSDNLEVKRTAVADDQWEILWNGNQKRVYPSDHRPIIADVVPAHMF